jgi:hypothetical protein
MLWVRMTSVFDMVEMGKSLKRQVVELNLEQTAGFSQVRSEWNIVFRWRRTFRFRDRS